MADQLASGGNRSAEDHGDFGAWFRSELDKRGWIPHTFSQRAGFTYTSLVYKWARGESVPTPRSCQIIADALDINYDVVLMAAGYRARDERVPGIVRAELAALLNGVDEALLAAILPWFQALNDDRIANETIVRISQHLPGPSRDE